eukprot:7440984-Ditylum_brightwellii.AAC.1
MGKKGENEDSSSSHEDESDKSTPHSSTPAPGQNDKMRKKGENEDSPSSSVDESDKSTSQS